MIDIDITKYENSVINNLDRDNAKKIVSFLISENCDYIEQLLEDYLDIFVFEYEDFVKKYNNNLINEIRDDMNILEEFYY